MCIIHILSHSLKLMPQMQIHTQHKKQCYQCIDTKDKNDYHYKNNSVLVSQNAKSVRIQKSRFGKNNQPQNNQHKQNNRDSMICNSCRGYPPTNTARYICLRCRYQPVFQQGRDFVDLYEPCMKLYIEGNKKVSQKLKDIFSLIMIEQIKCLLNKQKLHELNATKNKKQKQKNRLIISYYVYGLEKSKQQYELFNQTSIQENQISRVLQLQTICKHLQQQQIQILQYKF